MTKWIILTIAIFLLLPAYTYIISKFVSMGKLMGQFTAMKNLTKNKENENDKEEEK